MIEMEINRLGLLLRNPSKQFSVKVKKVVVSYKGRTVQHLKITLMRAKDLCFWFSPLKSSSLFTLNLISRRDELETSHYTIMRSLVY